MLVIEISKNIHFLSIKVSVSFPCLISCVSSFCKVNIVLWIKFGFEIWVNWGVWNCQIKIFLNSLSLAKELKVSLLSDKNLRIFEWWNLNWIIASIKSSCIKYKLNQEILFQSSCHKFMWYLNKLQCFDLKAIVSVLWNVIFELKFEWNPEKISQTNDKFWNTISIIHTNFQLLKSTKNEWKYH